MILSEDSKFGNYHIEESLGSGAMGEVYRATDNRLDRTVAIKLIRKELASSASYRQRLADEAKAAAKIDSANVVRVWEYSVCDGIPYIAMEYVAGRDLTGAATEFDLTDKLRISLQIAEGVMAAHSVNLIHGDLKPDNILLTDDLQVKILDLGLAKPAHHESIDEHGNIAGTLHYLAPEQLSGEAVTCASDQFSYGVLLYELLTARRPFVGDYPAAIIYSTLHEDPMAPIEIDQSIPDWLNLLVLKLLAKKPEHRFADMSEVADLLRADPYGEHMIPIRGVRTRSKTVTVIDLRNLSSDSTWDYFCEGFTDDVVSELSRRTNLVVSAQPAHDLPRDIREVFQRFRSDFIVSGSLLRGQSKIRLNLFVHGEDGHRLVSSKAYEETEDHIFDLLLKAAQETSRTLAEAAGQTPLEVGEFQKPNFTAYDYYLKGKSYYQTNTPENLDFAKRVFEKALEIDPEFALAYSGLADVYAFQYMAYYDRSEERIEEARLLALKAIEINPNFPEGHRSLGRYYQFIGDMENCEKCYLRAIKLNPKYALAYRSLAWQKYQESDYASALEWATKALRLAPTDTETILLIGVLHTYGDRYTAAMVTLVRATEISPDYGRAYYNLGLVYMKLGVLDLALENFELATKYQGDPNCCVDAGLVYLMQRKYDKAEAVLQKSIEADFFPFIAYTHLGLLERLRGHSDRSRKYFGEAIAALKDVDFSVPENVQVQAYCALAQAGSGDVTTARETLFDITSRDNLIGDVWHNIARSFALLGESEVAQECVRKALAGTPGPTEREVALDPYFADLDIKAQSDTA
ncbi:MAG: hypothetical protein DRP45_10840 [Candidatus Zixiibacteriota bacterium]|nr:MAG: hypothetical protein DRP45_10840 [candidate division Zixibacteria bacterium]